MEDASVVLKEGAHRHLPLFHFLAGRHVACRHQQIFASPSRLPIMKVGVCLSGQLDAEVQRPFVISILCPVPTSRDMLSCHSHTILCIETSTIGRYTLDNTFRKKCRSPLQSLPRGLRSEDFAGYPKQHKIAMISGTSLRCSRVMSLRHGQREPDCVIFDAYLQWHRATNLDSHRSHGRMVPAARLDACRSHLGSAGCSRQRLVASVHLASLVRLGALQRASCQVVASRQGSVAGSLQVWRLG